MKVQESPDPTFPTVSFPNPEEKGALDEAQRYASENNCNVIIANDPDADRLAVAEKQSNGDWYVFTGNEIGVILGQYAIKKFQQTLKICWKTLHGKILQLSLVVLVQSYLLLVQFHYYLHHSKLLNS